jgi:hypothetical protein
MADNKMDWKRYVRKGIAKLLKKNEIDPSATGFLGVPAEGVPPVPDSVAEDKIPITNIQGKINPRRRLAVVAGVGLGLVAGIGTFFGKDLRENSNNLTNLTLGCTDSNTKETRETYFSGNENNGGNPSVDLDPEPYNSGSTGTRSYELDIAVEPELPRKLFQHNPDNDTFYVNIDIPGLGGSTYIAALGNLGRQQMVMDQRGEGVTLDGLMTPAQISGLSFEEQVFLVNGSGLAYITTLSGREIGAVVDLTEELYVSNRDAVKNWDFKQPNVQSGLYNVVPLNTTFVIDYKTSDLEGPKPGKKIVKDSGPQILELVEANAPLVEQILDDGDRSQDLDTIIDLAPGANIVGGLDFGKCMDVEYLAQRVIQRWPVIDRAHGYVPYEEKVKHPITDLEMTVATYFAAEDALVDGGNRDDCEALQEELLARIATMAKSGDQISMRHFTRRERLDLAARLWLNEDVSNRQSDVYMSRITIETFVNKGEFGADIIIEINDGEHTVIDATPRPFHAISTYEIRKHAKGLYGKNRMEVNQERIAKRRALVAEHWANYVMKNPAGTKKAFYSEMVALQDGDDYVYSRSLSTLRRDLMVVETRNKSDAGQALAREEAGQVYLEYAKTQCIETPLRNREGLHKFAEGYGKLHGVNDSTAEAWYHSSIGATVVEPANLVLPDSCSEPGDLAQQ